LDVKTGKADAAVALGGKPEFLAADGRGRAYINLVDKDQVAVVDTKAMKVVNKWPTTPGGSPVGMSMDVAQHRLFIGCRKPQKLVIMDADDGKVIAALPIGAGVDATRFDGDAFASCGDGTLAVARETAPGKFEVVPDGTDSKGCANYGPRSDDSHNISSHGGIRPCVGGPKPTHAQSRLVHDCDSQPPQKRVCLVMASPTWPR
jgi:hypothetical protein